MLVFFFLTVGLFAKKKEKYLRLGQSSRLLARLHCTKVDFKKKCPVIYFMLFFLGKVGVSILPASEIVRQNA